MLRKQDSQREVAHGISFLLLGSSRSESMTYGDGRVVFTFSHGPHRYLNLESHPLTVQHGLKDSLHIPLSILDTVSMANGHLLLMSVRFEAAQKKYGTTIRKRYNRDYLINQLERHEHLSEPAAQ
jgi:hypothetical protein